MYYVVIVKSLSLPVGSEIVLMNCVKQLICCVLCVHCPGIDF